MVTQTISQLLDGPLPTLPRYEVGGSMDTFRAGYLVTISRAASKKPDFKLLKNIDEIWAFSIRTPRDFQTRLLGRFVQKDIFVATELHLRNALGGPMQYNTIAMNAANNWDAITGGIKPLRSLSNSDYLGHTVRDMDEND